MQPTLLAVRYTYSVISMTRAHSPSRGRTDNSANVPGANGGGGGARRSWPGWQEADSQAAQPRQAPAQRDLPTDDELGYVESLLSQFEQLERQLQDMRDGLLHSHRLATLGTIATVIAHEFNNILTPVISYAQLALMKDDPDSMRQALEKTLASGQRAAKICDSLLGFARETDEVHAADLRKTIDETLSCLARDPAKDGIELTVDVPDTRVCMSSLNLQQVLLNLVLNARQAMGRRGGRLTITGRSDGRTVSLSVADTGPGIPPEVKDRLFEPFVSRRNDDSSQADSADDSTEPTRRKGTGLGLSICRDLVRAAGGTIRAESEAGRGATFYLTIPAAENIFEST